MDNSDDPGFLGRGWSFPPRFDRASLNVSMSVGADNINQALRLLLKTEKGSRSFMPEYGSDLRRFLFKRIDATRAQEIIASIKFLLMNGEPRIEVIDVAVGLSADAQLAEIQIQYQIRQTNSRHNYVFPYSEIEGSNLNKGDYA